MTKEDFSNANMQQLKRAKVVEDLPQRLQAWFGTKVRHARNLELVSIDRSSGAAGMSAEIFIVTARWTDGTNGAARQQKFVVRAEINAPTNATANANQMIATLKILGSRTDLPVPKMFWAEHDRSVIGGPFCVMEFLEGIVAPDSPPFTAQGWVFDGTPEQRRRMYLSGIRFLSRLHQLDWEALGLDYLLHTEQGSSQTAWHLNQSIALYDSAVEGRRGEFEDTAIRWLQIRLPAEEHLRVAWIDSRPGNILWKDFELSGALDWEMVTLLNPAYDVSLWLYADYNFAEGAGIKRLPGMMERDEFIETYENIADTRLHDYAFFEVLSAFRSHAIVANMIAIWERSGQHLYGAGITVHNCPTLNSFREIASRQV
jgi:aminoglycoside phosphotransferase (APT) family kinase protein